MSSDGSFWKRSQRTIRSLFLVQKRPVCINPIPDSTESNYWLSYMMIDEEAMCPQLRSGKYVLYKTEPGKACSTEILEALLAFSAEGRPIRKPMHMQSIYRNNVFITARASAGAGAMPISTKAR